MKSKNRMKKYSLIVSLILALSLALSPVSAFAEDLDTPIHEDPIDEIQSENGTSTTNISLSYWEPSSASNRYITGVSNVTYSMAWTEGISSYFTGVVYSISNMKIDGTARSFDPVLADYDYYYDPPEKARDNANGYAFQDFIRTGGTVTFRVRINVSVYGEITHFAQFRHR